MKYKSNLLAQASGSVAGSVFSRNAGGMYMRNRSVPTNPNTTAQQNVRSALSNLSTYWGQVLTDEQRTNWGTYAQNVPLKNSLGDTRPIPPLSMFVRCNSPRWANVSHTAVIANGPSIMAMANITTPTLTVATGIVSIAFHNTDDWATTTGGYLFVYAAIPQSPTINFFKGPFKYLTKIAGNTTTPPTSPAVLDIDYPTGTRLFVRVNASNADGRLSTSAIISVDIS